MYAMCSVCQRGTCTSKLIAAKPSFEETLFQIPGVPGQEAVSAGTDRYLEKMEIIQENDGTKARYGWSFHKDPNRPDPPFRSA